MIMDGTSERRFQKTVAVASILATVLGACQKMNTITPFGGQADKTPAQQPDENAGGASNLKQPRVQDDGDTGQKNQ